MSKESFHLEFAFQKQNYIILLGGIAILVLGYFLMSGGGSTDPNVFLGEYILTDSSFELMNGEFAVSEDVIQKVSPLKDRVFESEELLLSELQTVLGNDLYEANRFKLRSSATINAELFSARRITIAPIIVLFGYLVILIGIMKKFKPKLAV